MKNDTLKDRHIPTVMAPSFDQEVPLVQSAVNDGLLSWAAGFPPECSLPLPPLGTGKAPQRANHNQMYNLLTSMLQRTQYGIRFPFDAQRQIDIGGYPAGTEVMVWDQDAVFPVRIFYSLKDNNLDNFWADPSFISVSWIETTPKLNDGGLAGAVPLGTILENTGTGSPPGCIALNGELYPNMQSLFPDFYSWLIQEQTAGRIRTITQAEFDAERQGSGTCGGWVINGSSVRVPYLGGITQADPTYTPSINGELGNRVNTSSSSNFTPTTVVNKFMMVYSQTVPISTAEMAALFNNLNGKANIDLTNITPASGLRRLVNTSSIGTQWYKYFEEIVPETGEKIYWLEQGGRVVKGGADVLINLNVPFVDIEYTVSVASETGGTFGNLNPNVGAFTTTTFRYYPKTNQNTTLRWIAMGRYA